MLALGALMLFDARKGARQQAEQASANLTLVLERDIARDIALYDISLQGVISALQQPGIAPVRSKIWHMAAFDGTASANDLGSTLVLNGAGDVIANSTSVISHALNLADRDYFRIHQNKPDVGLFFSRPFRSRL